MGDKLIRRVKEDNFVAQGTMYRSVLRPGADKPEAESMGKYGLSVVPGSFQGKRVQWSVKNGKWLVDMDEEELQKLVKRSSLKHLSGSREGELIKEANIYDPEDPFFTHKDFMMWMEEGNKDMSDTNAIDKIVLSNFSTRDEVRRLGDQVAKYRGVGVEYEIVDKNYDRKIKEAETKKHFDMTMLIAQSVLTKKLKLARILNIDLSKDMNEESVNTQIYNRLEIDSKKRDEFLEISKLPTDEFDLRYYVTMGMDKRVRVIRWSTTKHQYIFNAETPVGRNKEGLFEFFGESDNYPFYESLKEIVDQKFPIE